MLKSDEPIIKSTGKFFSIWTNHGFVNTLFTYQEEIYLINQIESKLLQKEYISTTQLCHMAEQCSGKILSSAMNGTSKKLRQAGFDKNWVTVVLNHHWSELYSKRSKLVELITLVKIQCSMADIVCTLLWFMTNTIITHCWYFIRKRIKPL